jgi:hypothetical protein
MTTYIRVFKECPHPDEKQRQELSKELKLSPRQIKFWFQNKRTQMKVIIILLQYHDHRSSVCVYMISTLSIAAMIIIG